MPELIRQGALSVGDVLNLDVLAGAELLAGGKGLKRRVERMNVMTVPEILEWTKPFEFMLATGFPLPQDPEDFSQLIRNFAQQGLSALGIKFGDRIKALPAIIIDTADEVELPIVRIPESVGFDDILSSIFSEIIQVQTSALTRSQEIHQSFLNIVLGGGQLVDIVNELSDLLEGIPVAVVDSQSQIVASTHGTSIVAMLKRAGILENGQVKNLDQFTPGTLHSTESDQCLLLAPIQSDGRIHGYLLALSQDEELDPTDVVAIEQAAVVAVLDWMRQVSVTAVSRQFEVIIMNDIINARGNDMEGAIARASSLSWDLGRTLTVAVGGIGDFNDFQRSAEQNISHQEIFDQLLSEVRKHDPKAAAVVLANELVVIAGVMGDTHGSLQSLFQKLQGRTDQSLTFGVSRNFLGPYRIPQAYHEARTALRLGGRLNGSGSATPFNDLGLFRLLSLIERREELNDFVNDTLGGLLALDEPERSDLLHTLETLLEVHLNVAEASRRLHFHYNTVRFRASKIETLIGPFTEDGRLALQVAVALQVLAMPDFGGLSQ